MPGDASARLAAIGTRLVEIADAGLTRQATVAVGATTRPLRAAVRNAAARQLPQQGGLAARVATQPIATSVVATGTRVTARLRMSAPDAVSSNAGVVTHPVFQRPDRDPTWVQQSIPAAAGWWTTTLDHEAAPVVEAALSSVITSVVAEIEAI